MLPILILAAAATVKPIPYDARDERAATTWIAQSGHRFDAAGPSPAELAPLIAELGGAQVIGIGEATHGTHQDEAFKAELIKALVRAGAIDMLAIECSRAAAAGFDRYVRTGEGDPVALIRSPSFFSIWRNDDFGGLLLWLRAWNMTAAKPIRIIGIDNQDASVDAALALEFLSRHDSATANRLRAAMQPLLPSADGTPVVMTDWVAKTDGPAFAAVFAAATDLEKSLADALPAWRADPGYDEASYAARTARQGLFEFDGEYHGADRSKLTAAYYARRDAFMAENLIARLGPDRAALWAHDQHVISTVPDHYLTLGFRNLGWFVREKLGPAYRTVNFTWSEAVLNVVSLPRGAPHPAVNDRQYVNVPLRNDRPGDLGHVFAPLPGDAWWVNMASRPRSPELDRWAARPIYHGWAGWRIDPEYFQANPQGDATDAPGTGIDVLVWFRTMGPARIWPKPKPAN